MRPVSQGASRREAYQADHPNVSMRANGKVDVKVSHLMAHSAGLSGWKEKLTKDDTFNLSRSQKVQVPLMNPCDQVECF